VQLAVPGPNTAVGEQARLLTWTGMIKVTSEVALEPLAEAVTVAVPLVDTVPAAAAKVAVVAPAGTVMEPGTVREALLLESGTVKPPVNAALLRVTVQVLVSPEERLAGVQARLETRGGAINPRENIAEDPLAAAVRPAVASAARDATVTVKDTVVAPAAAVIEAGRVTVV